MGDYTFSSWKVAISGFYKRLNFVIVPPIDDKPVVFDDTVYFLACASRQEAEWLTDLLNSDNAQAFFKSMIFWEDKRPVTIDILKRLHIQALARAVGRESDYLDIIKHKGIPSYAAHATQLRLLEDRKLYS